MENLTPILEQLQRTRAGLESVAAQFPEDHWRRQPHQESWSAAEVIAHLTMVEDRVTQAARKAIQHPPRPTPIWRRLHLPVWIVGYRLLRFKTPVPLDSSLIAEKSEMLSRLAGVRQQTLALLDQVRDRDLSVYWWKHPLLGPLRFYDWFRMVAHHEFRHTKQLREILRFAPYVK